MKHFWEKGQNLIEITIGLAVIGVILGGLAVVILTGMKNSQFAQNQVKATKYAQETIDQIKALRDQKALISVFISGSPYPDLKLFDEILVDSAWCPQSTPCYFKLTTSDPFLTQINPNQSDIAIANEENLSRQIILYTIADKQKYLIVKIKWTDTSGLHESNLQTILTPK